MAKHLEIEDTMYSSPCMANFLLSRALFDSGDNVLSTGYGNTQEVSPHQHNCATCGANEFKHNKCTYCGTENI